VETIDVKSKPPAKYSSHHDKGEEGDGCQSPFSKKSSQIAFEFDLSYDHHRGSEEEEEVQEEWKGEEDPHSITSNQSSKPHPIKQFFDRRSKPAKYTGVDRIRSHRVIQELEDDAIPLTTLLNQLPPSPPPHPRNSVPATPSLIHALERVNAAQREARVSRRQLKRIDSESSWQYVFEQE
jgi:hypothetical protein